MHETGLWKLALYFQGQIRWPGGWVGLRGPFMWQVWVFGCLKSGVGHVYVGTPACGITLKPVFVLFVYEYLLIGNVNDYSRNGTHSSKCMNLYCFFFCLCLNQFKDSWFLYCFCSTVQVLYSWARVSAVVGTFLRDFSCLILDWSLLVNNQSSQNHSCRYIQSHSHGNVGHAQRFVLKLDWDCGMQPVWPAVSPTVWLEVNRKSRRPCWFVQVDVVLLS